MCIDVIIIVYFRVLITSIHRNIIQFHSLRCNSNAQRLCIQQTHKIKLFDLDLNLK